MTLFAILQEEKFMTFKKTLMLPLALTLATGLALTGCSGVESNNTGGKSKGSSSASSDSSDSKSAKAVAEAHQSFLTTLFTADGQAYFEALAKAGGVGSKEMPTREELLALADSLELFDSVYFPDDISDDDLGGIVSILVFTVAQSNPEEKTVAVEIPAEAVTIKGDKATIDASKVSITLDGQPSASVGTSAGLILIDGKWMLDASTLIQSVPQEEAPTE